ncbi:MAG: hypothetical protein HYW25_02905 [Candidatus Aenigmarchaeota archaeon]|nr:hypothetical protein [Candidatus Aenigmarchaeota archaeon]
MPMDLARIELRRASFEEYARFIGYWGFSGRPPERDAHLAEACIVMPLIYPTLQDAADDWAATRHAKRLSYHKDGRWHKVPRSRMTAMEVPFDELEEVCLSFDYRLRESDRRYHAECELFFTMEGGIVVSNRLHIPRRLTGRFAWQSRSIPQSNVRAALNPHYLAQPAQESAVQVLG